MSEEQQAAQVVETEPDYRFTLANERTFLAWIRTALGLVAGGVVVHQLIDAQATGEDADGNTTYKSYEEIAAVQDDAAGEAPSDAQYTETQREFSDAVNALSEPLSKVAGTILH